MPLTDRNQAKDGGFAQVREALIKFEGDVTSAEFGQWGGQLVDDEGKPVPPKEFLEITCENVEVLESKEELSMDISKQFNFRVNCSDYKGSFWVDKFLESADQHKVLVPTGLMNKRVTFKKETLEANNPKFNSTNYVIAGVKEARGDQPASQPSQPAPSQQDQMEQAANLAVGKTESQFKTAIALDPNFSNSPLLSLAKAGMLTQALVNEGKLVVDNEGKYQKQ